MIRCSGDADFLKEVRWMEQYSGQLLEAFRRRRAWPEGDPRGDVPLTPNDAAALATLASFVVTVCGLILEGLGSSPEGKVVR